MRNEDIPFGMELAQLVANHLMFEGGIYYQHRDYCGMGLAFVDGSFHYGEVFDGFPSSDSGFTFLEKDAFIGWLAEQTDQSLSRSADPNVFFRNNQTITRARLLTTLNNNHNNS
jgi:hypothetical protein